MREVQKREHIILIDQSWQPYDRITWQDAMRLWCKEKIEILENYPDREIRAVTFTMPMPSVVRFLAKVRRKQKAIKFSRDNLFLRDQGLCRYCLRKLARPEAKMEHVVPRCQGGKTTWTNIVISCETCNLKKGGRTPAQAGMKLHGVPVKPDILVGHHAASFVLRKQNIFPETWKMYLGIN